MLGALDGEGLLSGTRPSWTAASLQQKGGAAVGKTKRGKGTKWMVLATVKVFRWEFGWKVPLRQKLRLRKPRSKKSVPDRKGRPRQKPERVIADRGYDSDPLRRD